MRYGLGSLLDCLFLKFRVVKRYISEKLEPKSDKCLFVGYSKETKGYYFYNNSKNKVSVARNSIFLERERISKGTSGSKI